MDNGWIKLHRKTLNNPAVMKDADHMAVWVWLLLSVTHKPIKVNFAGKIISLLPGQLTCGRQQIAEESQVEESKVERVLNLFKSEQQIEQQTSNKCRLITIKNWEEYQGNEQQNEQQLNNKRTTTEQQLNTKQEYKEYKEEREERKNSTPSQLAKDFFLSVLEKNSSYQEMVQKISQSRNLTVEQVSAEFDKFASYWTELTRDGKRQRWELEKVFETQRRLSTWFQNVNKFSGASGKQAGQANKVVFIS